MRPRAGLPLGGLLPPHWFGTDAELGFSSESENARYGLENEALSLFSGDWHVLLALDRTGKIETRTSVVFDVIIADRVRRVRCKPRNPATGTFSSEEIAPNETSGSLMVNCPYVKTQSLENSSVGHPDRLFFVVASTDSQPLNRPIS